MAVTLKDISTHTGINVGTISHVLNNRPKAQALPQKTRDKIFAAAKELGYTRNELAATIRTGVSTTIALIVDFNSEGSKSFINSVISGVLIASTELGYGVKLYTADKLESCLKEIDSHCIKHIIAETVDLDCRQQLADYCKTNKLSLNFIFERPSNGFPSIASDDRQGTYDAVSLLVKNGHRRIALICSTHSFFYMDERHNGYLDGLKAAGIGVNKQFINCSLELKESERAIEKMLDLPPEQRPTAFCCIADSLALIVERVAFKRGLSVPNDISVIGFSNSDNIDCGLVPLSSISQPYEEMGTVALQLVLGKPCSIKPTSDNRYLLPTSIVERESVGVCTSNNNLT